MSDQVSNLSIRQKLDYYRWPIGIVLFFVLLAVVNAHLAWVAITHSQDQIEDSPYQRGIEYQKVIDQRLLASELGLTATVSVIQSNSSNSEKKILTVVIGESENSPPINQVRARTYYPQTGKFDSEIVLQKSGDDYTAAVKLPLSGLCMADIWIDTPRGTAFLREKFWIN